MEVCNIGNDQNYPKEKKCNKAKWLSEEALQIAEKGRKAKVKREKERDTHLNAECLMNYGMRFVTLYKRQGSRPSPWKINRKVNLDCLLRSPVFSLDSTNEQIRSYILAVEIICDLVLLTSVKSRNRSLE